MHLDRGIQYASVAHQTLPAKHGMVGSMSREGNCRDNATMERFFLNLKMERVWQRDYANHAEATSDIADYIVSLYNNVRLHSSLGNLPPNAFERQSAITQPIGVCEITRPGHFYGIASLLSEASRGPRCSKARSGPTRAMGGALLPLYANVARVATCS